MRKVLFCRTCVYLTQNLFYFDHGIRSCFNFVKIGNAEMQPNDHGLWMARKYGEMLRSIFDY